MTTTLKWGWALLLALCASVAYADPPARVGRLNYVHGTVSLAPAQAPDAWSIAALNRPLTAGDRLWTDRDGYAEFHVGSTAVRLAPRTNVDVLALDDDTLQLRLAQGDVNLRVRDVSDDDIEVSTPNGAVLLEQAGSYRIRTDAAGDATSIIVHQGRAHVLAPSGALSLRAGQHVTFRGPDGVPSEIVAAHMDAFDNWSAELDRREDRIAATRYVSPHMTGYEDLDAHGTWRTMPEYGAVWVPRVASGWAPYRHGHWVWIEPWGWTWVDDAPWGFAPFHYGRWVWLDSHWAWAPGPRVIRPVYAPALVAFVGGSNWSVSIGSGPAVGWFPLGWREPYFPWYRTSPTYVRNVNVTHVQNITVYNDVTRINYRHRARPQAVTVVPREAFVSARPVPRHLLQLPASEVTRAPLVVKSAPAEPVRSSFAARRAETRPPEAAVQREVVATRRPRPVAQSATAAESSTLQREAPRTAPEPRVRVIERQRADDDAPRRRAQGGAVEAQPRERPAPGPQGAERRGPAAAPREDVPRAAPNRESTATPSAPRPQQPDQAKAQRERGAAAPSPKPPAAQDRPRADDDRGPAREQTPQKRPEREPQPNRAGSRNEPQNRAQDRGEAQREQRPAQPESRQRPEPRSESTPGPRAEPVRPQRPEPRPEAQRPARPPQAESQQQSHQRAQPQRPEPRAEARPPRAEAPRPPQAQQQQRGQPRPEAHGPQNAPAPRSGGAPGRDNRERRDRD